MLTMLESDFKDDYTPKVMPDNKAMADILKQKTGAAYDTTFRENVIKHHRQGLQMMDQFLPKLSNPTIKQMAQKMKEAQTKDIAKLERQLGRS